MNPYHSLVSERAGERCEYCLAPDSAFNFPLEVDHFVPGAAGGSNNPENLVLACRSCNSYKAFHQLGLSEESPDERLSNPRIERWIIHFRLDVETAQIIGLTPIGTGTVNRLRFNSHAQIRARRFWLSTGLIGE